MYYIVLASLINNSWTLLLQIFAEVAGEKNGGTNEIAVIHWWKMNVCKILAQFPSQPCQK